MPGVENQIEPFAGGNPPNETIGDVLDGVVSKTVDMAITPLTGRR